jgi:dihydropteroate synthase
MWSIRGRVLRLGHPIVMGILNVTPDSFSDGGRFFSSDHALRHALEMLDEGADIIDVGGESTRPQGAVPVPADEECRRVLPVIERLARERPDAIMSIDTAKSDVASAALDAGAHIVNDVSGLRLDPAIAQLCATRSAGLVLMHSRGNVSDMATFKYAEYKDVVTDVLTELEASVMTARRADVKRESIVVDPGIGFSKKSEHSLAMLAAIPRLLQWGYPVMVGVSRKRFIGEITGQEKPEDRLGGTVGANVAALILGARIFRVHDVSANRQALDVAWEILRARNGEEATGNRLPTAARGREAGGDKDKG